MTFWIVISLMSLLIAALLGLAMMRGRRDAEPAAAYDLRVYREQLAGVDRDLSRGVIAEGDADRIRTEISRRILAADAQVQQERQGSGPARPLTLGTVVLLGAVLIGGAMMLYRSLGAPGYGDLPLSMRLELANEIRSERPDQAAAEARMPAHPTAQVDESYARLLTQLRETVAGRPDDLQGQALLAQHEANVGNFTAAYAAQRRVVELSGDAAGAAEFADLAELMIRAAGGYVSPEAEAALKQALDRDPGHGPARYYWGLMLSQIGRPDLAFTLWQETLAAAPAGAPWGEAIRAQIEEMAYRAGVNFSLPAETAPLAGPSSEDIAAAGEMSAEERQEMIRGMVDRLSDRLATEGGAPEEWGRLIGALGVLGEGDRAQAIYDEAHTAFAADDAALQLIDEAARAAGLTQ